MVGWKRPELWSQTGLEFKPPSPNIRTPTEALLYPGVGMFEATNVSVGRGTDTPFEVIGAPWMNGVELARRLSALGLAGVAFEHTVFAPSSDLYQGHLCSGVRFRITDPVRVRPVDLFVQAAVILRDLSGKDFQPRWNEIARVTGSSDFETMYKMGRPVSEILDLFHKSAAQFQQNRRPYLLY